jgi:hypothetical protein
MAYAIRLIFKGFDESAIIFVSSKQEGIFK